MKKFLLATVFALLGTLIFSQERIAVFPFEDMDNLLTKNESVFFYRQFSNEFTNKNAGRFIIVPRQDVEKLFNAEEKFQLSDLSAKAKTAETQRVLNGTRILSGIIGKVGNRITISVSLYTFPELSQLPGGVDLRVSIKDELFDKIPELVQKMQNAIAAGGAMPEVNKTASSNAQQYDPESDFKAELMEGGKSVRITKYRGEKWAVRIPPKIQGIPVTHIGNEAFAFAEITNVIIPDCVTSIEEQAFFHCTNLTNVTIPSSVTNIGGSAFYRCTSLNSVTIPESVTEIGGSAFCFCTSLTVINVNVDNKAYTALNGILYNKDRSVLHTFPAGKKGNFIIPHGVITIEDYAFAGCTSLTGVTISNSVTNIGNNAFDSCESLTNVTISNSVTIIGDFAFYHCISLTSIIIPDSVTSMGRGTFSTCIKLSKVNIGNGVVSIDTYIGNLDDHGAFSCCESLTSIVIGNRVTKIGKGAFFKCVNLTSVTIPKSVINIEDGAFDACTILSSVTFQGTITRDKFSVNAFRGNLRDVFYAVNPNGTPGTYRTSNPGYGDAVWKRQ